MTADRIVRLDVSSGATAAALVAAVVAACPDLRATIAADLDRAFGAGAVRFVADHGGRLTPSLDRPVVAPFATDPDARLAALDAVVADAARALSRRLAAAGPGGDADGDPVGLVAAASLLVRAEKTRFSISPLPLGASLSPITAALLTGFRFADLPAAPVTPLGAALLAELADRRGASLAEATLVGAGVGVDGASDPAAVVRALVLAPDDDEVVVITFEVDDMTGEEIGTAAERLRAVGGVLDLSLAARIGKKHRPSTEFRLLVRPADREAVERRCFLETSTIGLRRHTERRTRLPRRADHRPVGPDDLPVKTVVRPNGVATTKAESDGLDRYADLAERRAAKTRAEGPEGTDT